MANDSLGSIITQGNFLRIDNAFVDEVSSAGRNTGFIIISYSVPWQSGVTTVQQLRLGVGNMFYDDAKLSRVAIVEE